MRILAIAALAACLPVAAAGPALAQSTGTMNGVQHVGAKARCSPGDPNVMVDQKSKTFTLDKSANSGAMKPGSAKTMSDDAAAGAGSAGMHGTKSSMVSMCKSEAMSMGAKMKGGSTMKKDSM